MTIEQYMDELKIEKKDHNIIFEYPIPDELKRFLKKYEDTELPFGEIFDYGTIKKMSQRPPFNNEWFVFGKDKYFSYWVCKVDATKEEKVYTTWDHEMDECVGEAVCSDLLEFLTSCELDYDDFEDTVTTYTAILYNKASLSTLALINNILGLQISPKELLEKSKRCPNILGTVSHKTMKKAEDETYRFIKQYVKFNKRDW
ncbi:hypothetical protein SELR_13300 [Selenomonas ruminantium subsp. lactilytica TAM6421]|uniref:Uncharacterized protein n=1 Tax=Selenomonas ruminantium subsp. lactilytica (strain NBRC 103574 / TAM6421) TaxID=927704 RepID=I0GQK1_SELRL|nr:hypothetical protein [Selenomonas ruminantium]BAL83038.1 hypothetical protein SELR_13300 [Selenomonas ruminantium subsp. lactilytica TAM6421]